MTNMNRGRKIEVEKGKIIFEKDLYESKKSLRKYSANLSFEEKINILLEMQEAVRCLKKVRPYL